MVNMQYGHGHMDFLKSFLLLLCSSAVLSTQQCCSEEHLHVKFYRHKLIMHWTEMTLGCK